MKIEEGEEREIWLEDLIIIDDSAEKFVEEVTNEP